MPAKTASQVAGATSVKDEIGDSPSSGDLNGDLNGLLNGDLNGDLKGLLNGDLNGDLKGLLNGDLKGEPSAGVAARSLPANALACAVRAEAGIADRGMTGWPGLTFGEVAVIVRFLRLPLLRRATTRSPAQLPTRTICWFDWTVTPRPAPVPAGQGTDSRPGVVCSPKVAS